MSSPSLRRTDKQMSDSRARELLVRAHSGRLATVGADGWPYVVPLLYVWMNDEIYVHNAKARGHLRANVDHDPRACFEVDEPGSVFAYGRFECDTALSYASVIAFGMLRVVEDRDLKTLFCSKLMEKYGRALPDRPKDFFPRLDHITVYALAIDRLTGKETTLPATGEQWPARDRTKSPNAVAPT